MSVTIWSCRVVTAETLEFKVVVIAGSSLGASRVWQTGVKACGVLWPVLSFSKGSTPSGFSVCSGLISQKVSGYHQSISKWQWDKPSKCSIRARMPVNSDLERWLHLQVSCCTEMTEREGGVGGVGNWHIKSVCFYDSLETKINQLPFKASRPATY